jgi:hypothetical protein
LQACSFRDLSDLEAGNGAAGNSPKSSVGTSSGGVGKNGAGVAVNCAPGDTRLACIPLREDVAYNLHPMQQSTKCVDLAQDKFVPGTAVVLSDCDSGITQKFWLKADSKERLAIRSAWTGLCLQVASGSAESGAHVIVAGCAAEPERLWSVVVRDEGFSLVAAHSGLSLDAVGDSVSGNEIGLQQRDYDGGSDKKWQFAETTGGAVLLHSEGATEYLALVDGVVQLVSGAASAQPWKLLPGLADPDCVTFEVASEPRRYLRHREFIMRADVLMDARYYPDATFCMRAGMSAQGADIRALESLNFPGRFVTGASGAQPALELSRYDDAFRAKATWIMSGM